MSISFISQVADLWVFHTFRFQSDKILLYYLVCLVLYMLSKGTAHLFLLVSDGYLDNHDSGELVTEVKADSSLRGRCISIEVDPLQIDIAPLSLTLHAINRRFWKVLSDLDLWFSVFQFFFIKLHNHIYLM